MRSTNLDTTSAISIHAKPEVPVVNEAGELELIGHIEICDKGHVKRLVDAGQLQKVVLAPSCQTMVILRRQKDVHFHCRLARVLFPAAILCNTAEIFACSRANRHSAVPTNPCLNVGQPNLADQAAASSASKP